MAAPRSVVIVGAGFGGLACAALLGRRGFRVTLLEKNPALGGRAQVWEKDGFRFDMGPSWYLMPDVFIRFFAEFGKYPEQYYKLLRLDPHYRVFFGPADMLDIPADPDKLRALVEKIAPGSAVQLDKYLGVARQQYEIAMKDFMYRDYRSVFDFLTWSAITRGTRLRIFEHIDKFVHRYFSDERIAKIMEYTMVFLGGSPRNTPALYAIMSHVDFNLGVWYPYGGFGQLVEAFKKLCLENGVQILTNREVTAIQVAEGQARAVITREDEIAADIIVVNADYQHAETVLLPAPYRSFSERYWRKRTMGPSAFIIYLGLNRKIEQFQHHNLYLDASWDDHFRSIFDQPAWPDNFSYYVGCPSRTDPTVAPPGKENVFVLVPVAPGLTDDDAIRESFYQKVVDHLSRLTGEDINSAVFVKRIFTHRDFISAYHAFQGTALGMSHTLTQTAVFRPPHRSRKVANLWYVGNYTHPGVGIPMVLISSQITSDLIVQQYD